MSGAPYGYRYVRKTEAAPAAYTVLEAEARWCSAYMRWTRWRDSASGEMTRRINAEGIPTRKASARWETLDRLGPTAQLCVSRPGLLRQDAVSATDARDSPAASAGCDDAPARQQATSARAKSGSRSPCPPW